MRYFLCIALLLCATLLFAHNEGVVSDSSIIWLFFCAVLVFFMQAGFGMLEIGLTKAKNASNIIMKNLVDFSVGILAFWAVGWALMFGDSQFGGLVGSSGFFLASYEGAELSAVYRSWFFQAVFAATAATIVAGAVAGRTRFSAYILFSVCLTTFVYPVSGHWVWGGGWLELRGFYDFAGSIVVHGVGGWSAFVGAILLGARKGKYVTVDGHSSVRAVPGHNLPLTSLGVFILWFGWYGLNAGKVTWGHLDGTFQNMEGLSHVVLATTLAATSGMLSAMFTTWIMGGRPDPSMSMNGALAGLVGIAAGAYVIDPVSSVVVGVASGIIVVLSVRFIDRVLKVDDPVGAISVHGVCGVWGALAVGIFGDMEKIGKGLSRLEQIGVQALGTLSVVLWVVAASALVFGLLKLFGKLRVDEQSELIGLDISEHGAESYHSFQIFSNM